MKKEFKVIADLLPKNVRVLDVGCGDGSLMIVLIKEKNIEARGLELEEDNVKKCIYKGLSVIEGNAETELIINKRLIQILDTKKITNKELEELRLAINKDYVELFWIGYQG